MAKGSGSQTCLLPLRLSKFSKNCLKTPFLVRFFSKFCLRSRKFGQNSVCLVLWESLENKLGRLLKKRLIKSRETPRSVSGLSVVETHHEPTYSARQYLTPEKSFLIVLIKVTMAYRQFRQKLIGQIDIQTVLPKVHRRYSSAGGVSACFTTG